MKNKNKNTTILVLSDNTTPNEYGLFTDKIISITKDGVTMILNSEDIKKLEKVLGCRFSN